FLDAGLKLSFLRKRLKLIGIGGYSVSARKEGRGGVFGTKFDVDILNQKRARRTAWKDIKKIIHNSRLNNRVKGLSLLIFEALARAESRVHNLPPEDVHFHEIGDLDSIIDIVSTAIAVDELGIEEFYCLNLRLGKGQVVSAHGVLPLPAPASLELLKDKPVSFADVEHELITPTGAAILSALVRDFNARPGMDIRAIGYGAGSFKASQAPNLLRLIMGDSKKEAFDTDQVVVIETNIDDMNPAYYEYALEALFRKGALDAFLTPVYMKKTRPGTLLTVLARPHSLDALSEVILRETTSSGVRYYAAQRKILNRISKTVKTRYGPLKVKLNFGPGNIKTVSPEYEDCGKMAKKAGVPLKAVFEEAKKKFG
ncbi:MAG: nickel pincer cofactor biosynthesis protein LarC, partial [Candidatus Omnitrophica bacterium]|nr:nickel pincer cofactor biosynthesis protein LarC [Candidatus Omnitrophota bacterium]